VLVVGAEQAEQRAGQLRRQMQDGSQLLRHSGWRVIHHEGAVAIHGGVHAQRAGRQESMPAARAVADHADPAVRAVQAPEVLCGTSHVPDQPLIWHPAGGAHGGRCVARLSPGRLP